MTKSPKITTAIIAIIGSFAFIISVIVVQQYRQASDGRLSAAQEALTEQLEQNQNASDRIQITNSVRHAIPLDQIYDGGPGKDGIPSIDRPSFITVDDAQREAQEHGLGLAVSLNGEHRFYPYQILVYHELVNDTMQGQPILVSFCPLCGSGLVFDRRLNGVATEFGVSGKLYNSDLLMYDRATDSLWSQILGQAVVGPLTGASLTQLNSNVMPFDLFAEQYPDGMVLSQNTGFARDYTRGPYGDYDTNESVFFPVANTDSRLHPKTRVIGIQAGGSTKAYVITDVERLQTISDRVGERDIRIRYADGGIDIADLNTGMQIIPTHTFWFAWFAFYPDTELFTPPGDPA